MLIGENIIRKRKFLVYPKPNRAIVLFSLSVLASITIILLWISIKCQLWIIRIYSAYHIFRWYYHEGGLRRICMLLMIKVELSLFRIGSPDVVGGNYFTIVIFSIVNTPTQCWKTEIFLTGRTNMNRFLTNCQIFRLRVSIIISGSNEASCYWFIC